MDSPLFETYRGLVCLFGGIGILGAIFFHPALLVVIGFGLFVILIFYNQLDDAVADIKRQRRYRSNRSKRRRRRK